jgi:hypothetical protein
MGVEEHQIRDGKEVITVEENPSLADRAWVTVINDTMRGPTGYCKSTSVVYPVVLKLTVKS